MNRTLAVLAAVVFTSAPVLAQRTERTRTERTRTRTETRTETTMREGGAGRGGLLLNPYPAYERPLPRRAYRSIYRLTPAEFIRLKAQGFSNDEVYMIANASRITGYDPEVFTQRIYNGEYAREIAYEFSIYPYDLRRILPEWRTPEWGAAVGEPPLTKRHLDVID
jgi:hypothetical protein